MIRNLGILVGLFFTGVLLYSFLMGAYTYLTEEHVETAEHMFHEHPKSLSQSSDGVFGKFDTAQLQRGYGVYKEVCSACHSLEHVAFRDLQAIGYNEAEVKAIAASFQVPAIDPETGEASTRDGLAADKFPAVYPNDVAARAANNNAVPPDLSLMTKARHNGPAYVYSLLTGYQNPPKKLAEEFPDSMPGTGLHYNPYFANLNLAMAPPITAEGQVSYADGTKASVDQMSKDVSAFLTWTAEPKMEKRKQTGLAVLAFLLIFTILAYLSYRNIWADKKH
ncbi:cytochrome c1 [Sphingorhabdus sp. Alg239-R122]|uniref:cytochrome c1 n=1 Tax=Sphingorhabdus sp. Alg239-R122 TaxID=2305989 RepID=UPI0013DB903E|nr:cytochrome c1 [Sphingorhabdus sp. Alg239-R122]